MYTMNVSDLLKLMQFDVLHDFGEYPLMGVLYLYHNNHSSYYLIKKKALMD